MLQPKRRKYRKEFRGKMNGKATSGANLDFGEFGLKSLGRGWLTARQIEAARKAIAHATKRQGKTWLRVFPHKPVTGKGPGSGMGSGKGDIKEYVAPIVPGRMLFEISGVPENMAKQAMKLASDKLPFATRFISKEAL